MISYEKMDPITHIHKRPDMYLGTLKPKIHDPEWVFEDGKMTLRKEPKYSDGLWRIFLEPISNVVDNAWRSRQTGTECKKIKVDIDPETAEITIWNDGQFIPIEINEQTKMYNPELIFGNLLTSSNYNDEEERLSSGRNGLGVKLTNVFSKNFSIECGDGEKIYKQTWTGHMRKVSKPKIKNKKNTGFTCISFVPDLELFGMEKLDSIIIGLFKKTCVDMSMVTNIPILLNGVKIHIKSLKDYALLYPQKDEKPLFINWNNNDIQKKKGEEIEIVICPSFDEEYHDIAFVNGIYTREGGVHVDAVANELCKGLLTKINKGKTTNLFSIKDVRPQFMIFVKAFLVNPTFSNQNKTRLQTPTPKVEIDMKFIQTICSKWDFMEKMNEISKAREFISLKKTEKKRGFKRIDGLDSANKAGGKESKDCTLILCEGLSARTYAVRGIAKGWNGKKGRDYFGVFPLRGKVMNARNASTASISSNKEITGIIQALNLKYKTDYTKDENFDTLSYGKIMIIADADVDGLHIASLIINLFHVLFPTLFHRKEPVLYWMLTPIAKIFPNGSEPITFYNDYDYQKELEKLTGRKFICRYYKGLGSSNDNEVRDTFAEKVVSFQLDKDADKTLHMVFSKNTADDRKKWMEGYDATTYDNPDDNYPITKFVNQEHIRFSIDDCKRSIPNLCDGLKLSQRKILFTMFKRNISFSGKSIKVAQLGGSVAELSGYHHGEICLFDTMIKMAQDFVGSLNNIPMLHRDGQFGCLAPETPILMWDGSIKQANEIQVGDILVGDDGNPRNVLALTNGDDNMYEIKSTIDNDKYNFICNSQHILTLYFKDNNIIYWKEDTNTWVLEYFDGTSIRTITKQSQTDKTSAYNQIIEIRNTAQKRYFEGPVVDIKLSDYLKLSKNDKLRMHMFTSINAINWDKKDVPVDPYLFGVLLGDGNADGSGLTVEATILLRNKHISTNYICNDMKTRLQLLAGFIDTVGHIVNNETALPLIEICQSGRFSKHLLYSLELIAKSLGFHTKICKIGQEKRNITTTNDQDHHMLSLTITGEGLDRIPTLHKKIIINNPRTIGSVNTMSFTVEDIGINKFYGWQVDKNERFLLGNFLVTHNSRLALGKDAANARYIHTKLMKWTRILFPPEDDELLSYILDDGLLVEPESYMPIIPLILVNGIKGAIGTGWSCSMPSHNPLEIVEAVRDWLNTKENFKLPELYPYFRGFTGRIEKVDKNKFKCYGILKEEDQCSKKRNKLESHSITEIPIECSIDKYKEFLEVLLENKKIKTLKNYSTPDHPDFRFTPSDGFNPSISNMNLSGDINLTNIVLFNNGRIKKYDTLHEIFIEFCRQRYDLYEKRKEKMIRLLTNTLEQEKVKLRFIKDVMADNIIVFKKSETQVLEQLKKHRYPDEHHTILLGIQIRSFTNDNVFSLEKKVASLEKQLKDLKATSIETIWNQELDSFVEEYTKDKHT